METFSALLALCARNSPVSGDFPSQRPVTRSFDVLVDVCLNKRLSKHSRSWWFETQLRPLWRHCNEHRPMILQSPKMIRSVAALISLLSEEANQFCVTPFWLHNTKVLPSPLLIHWRRVTHIICVSKLTIIGSDNGLSPGRCQAIIWTTARILLTWPLGTNFNEMLV